MKLVKVPVAAEASGVNSAVVYTWIQSKKLKAEKNDEGTFIVDPDEVAALASKRVKRRKRVDAPKLNKPATKHANDIERMAAVLKIYFPDGLDPRDYPDALLLVLAIEKMTPS